MEISIAHQTETQISVHVNTQYSHIFDLTPLILPEKQRKIQILNDPISYGQALYAALFAPGTPALTYLEHGPEHIILVTSDDDLDTIPWEYLCGPDGFLARAYQFVRGLPVEKRLPAPVLDTSLHIVALPSDPLSDQLPGLNIEAEWMNLKESITPLPFALTLERTRPATLKQLRNLVANQHHRVVHFMGHGGQQQNGAVLFFEKEDGDLDPVEAKELALRLRGTTFLVTLNACASATPGTTSFSNLAASLIHQKIPYVLGMRLSIYDDDARLFARAFYDDLARGTSVEEALLQARSTLARESDQPWAVGVPVLYTSLAAPSTGFVPMKGTPMVIEHQPRVEMAALPRAEGTFQGRLEDLKQLGRSLTGDKRSGILTIHGGGGIGKTTLAREAAERFAVAWPGGVWSTTLENLPERTRLAVDLAQFLSLNIKEIIDPTEIERRIFARLSSQRTLLVLDNAETLIEAIEADNAAAVDLGQFLQHLPGTTTSLLITSRVPLGWVNEEVYELSGLFPAEGADLFIQCAPSRKDDIDGALAGKLSEMVEGHPLSLRLLGSTFNGSTSTLKAFMEEYKTQAMSAQNKYRHLDHRHRSLYACIDTSVRHLPAELRTLLSNLSIFHAPFLPVAAEGFLDPDAENAENASSTLSEQLRQLWQRSLLAQRTFTSHDETLHFYHILPTTRLYIEQYLPAAFSQEELFRKFATVQANTAKLAQEWLGQTPFAATLAQQSGVDIERGISYLTGVVQARYKFLWSAVLYRLGATQRSLALLEEALEAVEGKDQALARSILLNMGGIYREIGQPQRSFQVYEQILPVMRETGDRDDEAATLNQMGQAADLKGQREQAQGYYEQALGIVRETNNRSIEASILNNMGELYRHLGQTQQALTYFQQSLPILRELQDRNREAVTLNNAALAFQVINQPAEALSLSEQALPILRELGNRHGEALVLQTIGRSYSALGKREQALSFLEQALALLREVGNRSGEAITLNSIAILYQNDGQSRMALDMFQEVLSIQREVGDRNAEAGVLINIATAYQLMGERLLALNFFEQALPLMREVGDRSGEAAILVSIARLYRSEQPEYALMLLESAHLPALLQNNSDLSEIVTAFNIMGDIYHESGQREKALQAYERMLLAKHAVGYGDGAALFFSNLKPLHQDTEQPQEEASLQERILREIEDVSGEADILVIMGTLCREMGQLERAMRLFKRAQHTLYEQGRHFEASTILNHIGEMYQELEQAEQALPFFEQALSIEREQHNCDGEISVLYDMAGTYRALGQPEQALTLYTQALLITREAKKRVSEAAVLDCMGSIYRDNGQLQQGLEAYEQALLIEKEVENRLGESAALMGMGDIYQLLEQPEQAWRFYTQALAIVREQNSRVGEVVLLQKMAATQKALGEFQQAFHISEQILPLLQEMSNQSKEASVLQEMGRLLYLMEQPKQAISYCEQALSLWRERGDRQGEASALHNIGDMYTSLRQPEQALNIFAQALSILREIGSEADEAATLNDMGRIYRGLDRPEQALELYEQALPLMRKVKDRAGEAVILANAGEMYRVTGRSEQALALFKQALDIEREVGNRTREASLLPVIGYIYQVIGQPEQALEFYEEALPLLREVKERSREISTLNAMGEIYLASEQVERAISCFESVACSLHEEERYDEEAETLFVLGKLCHNHRKSEQALYFFDQALSLQRELGNRSREAITLQIIGDFYRDIEQPDQALNLLEQALSIHREVGDRIREKATLNSIAIACNTLGQSERALKLHEQALLITREMGDRAGEAAILHNIAVVYKNIEQLEQASGYYELALPVMREVGNRDEEIAMLNTLGEIYAAIGQPEQALRNYEQTLPLLHEMREFEKEAIILGTMINIYQSVEKPEQILTLLERVLAISHDLGMDDSPEEAGILNTLGDMYSTIEQTERALSFFERSLSIQRKMENHVEEIAVLAKIALLLYQKLKRPQEALAVMESAVDLLQTTGPLPDSAEWTEEQLRLFMQMMQLSTACVQNTIEVMTTASERLDSWRTSMQDALQQAQENGPDQLAVDLFTALLALLNQDTPVLPPGHPYTPTIQAIQEGIVVSLNNLAQLHQDQEKLTETGFNKFTKRAGNFLHLAQEEAIRLQVNYIDTEHLLLGLVKEIEGVVPQTSDFGLFSDGEDLADQILSNLGVELNKIYQAVSFIIEHENRTVQSEDGLTTRAKRVIELAVDEARRLNHHYIGTGHFLLGLIREGEGIAAGVLESLGINMEKARTQTTQLLSKSDSPNM